jgi:alkylhydroperoxidase/carboxymuconolactone decarboxylase family protein YurZ
MPYYFNKALESGLTPGEISELVTHLAFYAGWPNAFSAVAVVKDLFVQRGIRADQLPEVSPELLPLAQAVPDEAIRVAFVEQNVVPVSPPFARYTGDLLYHEVWLRPGLAPRDRGLASCSVLIASGTTQFLPLYLSRTLDQGLTQEQVSEMLAHLAFYVGWARIVSASLVVKEVFDSRSK